MCFQLQTVAFRGHGFSLRRTGRASVGVATGRRVLCEEAQREPAESAVYFQSEDKAYFIMSQFYLMCKKQPLFYKVVKRSFRNILGLTRPTL